VAQTYAYDSFGKQTAASGSVTNPFRYAAREFDTETSLAYNRARYYDPAAGRFLNEDPMRFEGGSNFYAYTRNNSTNYADPSGLCPEPQTNQDPCAALGPGGGSISVPSPYGLIALQFNSSGFLNGFSVPLTGGSGTIQGGFHIGPNTRAGAGLSANGGVTIQFSNPILAPGAYPGTGGYIQSATFSGGMFTNVTGAVSILGIPLGPTSTSSSALLNYLNGNPLAISFANDLLSLLQYTSNNISCEFLSGGQ
jgi:RHS repeat-associated protein